MSSKNVKKLRKLLFGNLKKSKALLKVIFLILMKHKSSDPCLKPKNLTRVFRLWKRWINKILLKHHRMIN